MAQKQTKVITKRRKFLEVDIPIIRSKAELIAESKEQLVNRTIKLDLTRQLKGKSIEVVLKVKLENEKLTARPEKIKLMPYFIRRMIRKRISYVEDSFDAKTQNSLIKIKPFLITRKRVSRVVRKTLRNKCKNWIEDYVSEKTDEELFSEILSNRMQRSLSLTLKKTYPLSLCEVRVIEIIRPLNLEEIPKIKEKPKKEEEKEEFIDQLKEIEDEKIRKAEEEIKQAQEVAAKIEEKSEETQEKPKKRGRKKKEEKIEK